MLISTPKYKIIGGIVAFTQATGAIKNCKSHCDIFVQDGGEKVGMITGSTRVKTITYNTTWVRADVQTCELGGRIATTVTKENDVVGVNPDTMQPIYGEVEKPAWKTLVDKDETLGENDVYFYDHIYGGTTNWSGIEGYDGCSWLSAAPSVTVPAK